MRIHTEDYRYVMPQTLASYAGEIGALYLQAVIDGNTVWYRVRHNDRIKKRGLSLEAAVAFYNGVLQRGKVVSEGMKLDASKFNRNVTRELACYAGPMGTMRLEVYTDGATVWHRVVRDGRTVKKSLSLDRVVEFYNSALERFASKAAQINP